MARNKVKRLAAVALVAAGVFGGSLAAATSASASDPGTATPWYEVCPGNPVTLDWLSISNPTHCDRILGTWHSYEAVYSGEELVTYIDGTHVQDNITYADNEASCQADLYSGWYGSGSVLHRTEYTSGNATGYARSLGWNCNF